MVDGVAASNFIVQEDQGLTLDAAASERIKHHVRRQPSLLSQATFHCLCAAITLT